MEKQDHPRRRKIPLTYCPRGGMEGFAVTTTQLKKFAALKNVTYIDQYIPFPHLTGNEQDCELHDGFEDMIYWENISTGGHGWACPRCGAVVQWG